MNGTKLPPNGDWNKRTLRKQNLSYLNSVILS
jgi:hypothetical protein